MMNPSQRRLHAALALMHNIMAMDDLDPNYDIDTGIDTVLANVAARSSSGMDIPNSQWYALSSEAYELWQSLSGADRAIILGSPSKSSQSPAHGSTAQAF